MRRALMVTGLLAGMVTAAFGDGGAAPFENAHCVAMPAAMQQMKDAGFTILTAEATPFSSTQMIYFLDGPLVFAVVVSNGCAVIDTVVLVGPYVLAQKL